MDGEQAERLIKAIEALTSCLVREVHHEKMAELLNELFEAQTSAIKEGFENLINELDADAVHIGSAIDEAATGAANHIAKIMQRHD